MSHRQSLSSKSINGSQPQEAHFNRARASLRQALSWYSPRVRASQRQRQTETAALQKELAVLKSTLDKLDQGVIRMAVFGLVSRGKSAVLNALVGQKILPTGPLNGVTQWPRSVRWTPTTGKTQVELIDTPGLDEIAGEARAEMARTVARQSDLILFVVAGDITRTEYQALCELRQSQKPLILVFNKIDLYPEQDRQKIYRQLQQLGAGSTKGKRLEQLLSAEEIVMVAAEPAPVEVRVEWPDERVTYEWETPPPDVEQLKQKILSILNREGRSLLALNALVQAREAEASIARKNIQLRQTEAEEIIWRYTKYKALGVALNPIAVLDVLGGTVADLALIRALSRLYGLPMTGYDAGKLWKKILTSAGGVLLAQLGSSAILGLGKSAAAAASAFESPTILTAYAGSAITQAGIAGYGAYAVGQVAQVYLEQGCTWGPLGPSTVIQDILSEVDSDTILYRLRQELEQKPEKG